MAMTLEPCPFCGGRRVDRLEVRGRCIECQGCGASGPELPLGGHPEDIKLAWNERAHLSHPVQAVDVGAIRNVAAELKRIHPLDAQYDWCHGLSDEITRAIAASPPSNSPTTGAIGENGK